MPGSLPFTPGATVSRAVATASANVALTRSATSQQIMVTAADGADIMFINFGTSSAVTAALTDTPILPNTAQTFTISPTMTHVAAISAGTGTLYFTSGDGE